MKRSECYGKAKQNYICYSFFCCHFLTAFSVCSIIEESDHKCPENDCQICAQISINLDLLNNITPKPSLFSDFAVLLFAVIFSIGLLTQSENNRTLITLKVKLSN